MSNDNKCSLPEHQCKELMSKVYLALDGALSPQEEKDVFCEVEKHQCCFEKLELEKKYRNLLFRSCRGKEVPDSLINTIKERVSQLATHKNP